jgi:uncharacterized protein YegL
MAAVTSNVNQARARRVAVKRIEGFAKQFGEAHRNLARHAAFPLVLTPDLLYQIWANFVPEAPWTAVAHVLLSRLCRQVGYEMYEMDIADRNLLLRELKEQFGQERLNGLGEFLLDYVAQRLTEDDADTQDLAEAQEWTALAYTKPSEAVREFAEALSEKVDQEDMGEVLCLASLIETLAEPLLEAGFEPLLVYSRGLKSIVRGDLEEAKLKFGEVLIRKGQVTVAGVSVPLPKQVRKQEPSVILEFDLIENPTPRVPVILLLDTSSSMSGKPIQELNRGLAVFKKSLQETGLAAMSVEVAILKFGKVELVQNFVIVDQFTPPNLKAEGATPMGEAIESALDLLEERKAFYRANGIDYYKPWVFLITDGSPTDSWQNAAERVRKAEMEHKLNFFAVSLEGADMNILAQISPPQRPPIKLNDLNFSSLFVWLSSSMEQASISKQGEDVVLPPITGWSQV